MSLDIFGRGTTVLPTRGPAGVGFKYTEDQQYDLQNKRLCNVAKPVNPADAVNLERLQESLTSIEEKFEAQLLTLKVLIEKLQVQLTMIKFRATDNQLVIDSGRQ